MLIVPEKSRKRNLKIYMGFGFRFQFLNEVVCIAFPDSNGIKYFSNSVRIYDLNLGLSYVSTFIFSLEIGIISRNWTSEACTYACYNGTYVHRKTKIEIQVSQFPPNHLKLVKIKRSLNSGSGSLVARTQNNSLPQPQVTKLSHKPLWLKFFFTELQLNYLIM